MKTHFRSDELAKHWIEQVYRTGRCPSNMSFHGASFYSYGMEIGRIIFFKHKKAYLLTTDGYSATTSKHKNIIWSALHEDSIIFRVCALSEMNPAKRRKDAHAVVAYSLARARRSADKAARARERKVDRLESQIAWIEQAERATEFFELPAQDFESMKREVRRQITKWNRHQKKLAAEEAKENEHYETINQVREAFTLA